MFARVVVLLGIAALAGSAFGQTTTRPGEVAAVSSATAATEIIGKIKGTKINVRCEPGLSAYPCAQLNAPASVRIVERVPGTEFYKILPPEGTFSAIAKDDVKADAAGQTGTVIADSAAFSAGGEQRSSNFFYRQGQLKKGDTVTIIGATDKYYEIVPPKGAFFYIAARYVTTGDDGPSEVAVGTPRQNNTSNSTTKPTKATVTRPKVTTAQEPATGAMADFQAAEKMLQAEWNKPAEDRNLAGLIAKYKSIKLDSGDDYLKTPIDSRISFLESAVQARSDTAIVNDDKARIKAELLRMEQERKNLPKISPVKDPADFFAAQGVIYSSELYSNGALGKRYLVRDPQTLRITSYAQCTTGKVDLDSYIGKLVGIKGDSVYDKKLGVDIVEAQTVQPLSDATVKFAAPAAPVVNPLPTPAPAAAPKREPPAATPAAEPPAGPSVTPATGPTPASPVGHPAPVAKPVAEPKPAQTPTTAPADVDADTARPEFELNTMDDAKATITLPPTGLRVAAPTTQPAPTVKEDEYK